MKRIVVIVMMFLIGTICFNLFYNYTFTQDNIKYSVYVDGVSSTTFPPKGMYNVKVACDNSKVIWDYEAWKLSVTDTKVSKDNCYIEFNSTNGENISEKIKGMSVPYKQEDVKGKVVNENGFRYEGSNPDNYILFNNEIWRIIGVFNTTLSDDSTTQELTKIIRNESIGSFVYDANNVNDFHNSSLKQLLNGEYFNKSDATAQPYCKFYSTTVGRNCDFTRVGLNEKSRNMVENVKWHLGGFDSAGTLANVYNSERETTVPSGNNTITTSHIGLMYPSDYGYSTSACPRTTNLSSYDNSNCAGSAWMLNYGYEWTLSPYSSDQNYSWIVYRTGPLSYNNSAYGYSTRPVLYLKSTIKIIGGTGKLNDPYIIV